MIQIPEEIKTLLKTDSIKKNFRVHFPNGEHADLTNADIVEESVTLTESICSASQLKIGMCETPSIEFETIGVGYIRGAEIECSLEVECVDIKSHTWVEKYYTNSDVQSGYLIYISIQDVLGVEYVPAGIEVRFGSDEIVESIEIECSEDGILWERNEIASDVDSFAYIPTTEARENYVKGFYVKLYQYFYDEDGIMFGIKGYPLPGVIYKDDIDKYVYPIPYGTYIVDSCKKQANMSHRQIIGYNKFAYNSWQFNRITREMFNAGFYWVDKNYKGVSVESILRLIFPQKGTFEECELSGSSNWITVGYFRTSDSGGWTTHYVRGKHYTAICTHDTVGNFYMDYNPLLLTKFDQMDELIQEMDLQPLGEWPESMGTFYPLDELVYYSSNDWTLTMPESIAYSVSMEVGTVRDIIKNRRVCAPDIALTKTDSGGYWEENWYFYGTPRIRVFTQFQLVTTHDEVIFDTGEYIPTIYQDTTAPDLFVSPSNLYVPITNKKQKVNMVKSSNSSTVQKTLYKYDLSALNSINLKDLLQAYLEIQGKFGLITRDGNISFVSVNEAFNTPDDTIPKSDYYTLWYDDFPSKPYGRITASYKDGNGDDMFAYYDLVENFSDAEYKTYDISNNYFIKNYNYTEQQIQTILQTMGQNMTNISYMPMNLSMKGRPDLEAGDVVIVNSTEQEITGFIMQRTITGIQGLVDDISSQDDTDQSLLASLGTVYDEETGTLSLYLSESRR